MNKYYAGIGSRETPEEVLRLMEKAASKFSEHGYILRSGGAVGADTAFQTGSRESVILRPKDATEEAIRLASQFHPVWDRCNEYARKLHGRNSMIILGETLKSHVSFVVCWTKDGSEIGGTGLGMRIARHYSIPIRNLYCAETKLSLEKWIKEN